MKNIYTGIAMPKFYCILLLFVISISLNAQTYNSDFTTPAGTYSSVSPSGGVCLAPSFTAVQNVADASLTNYASVAGLLSATLLCTNTTYSIRAKLNFPTGTTFAPAGFLAGFNVQMNTVLSVSLLQSNISIRTYLGGTLRETALGANLAGISLLSSASPQLVFFTSTLSFDEVEFVFNTSILPVGVVFDYRFYNAFGALSVTPVKLKSFKATTNNKSVALSWITSAEINTSHFEIERAASMDGTFAKVGTVNAIGNSSIENNYQFNDLGIFESNYYYRLKTIDKDGHTEYSNIILVKTKGGTNWSVYPNVVTKGSPINVVMKNNEAVQVQLIGNVGQLLNTYRVTNNSLSIPTNTLPPGTYYLRLILATKEAATEKIIIQ